MLRTNNSSALFHPLLMLVILGIVVGQVILKYGQHSLSAMSSFSWSNLATMIIANMTNMYVIMSLVCTFIAGIAWILVIQKMPLSRAYPIISFNYLFISLISWCFFGETYSMYSLVGLVSITIGTVLLGIR